MSYQSDYILRMIEQFAQAIATLRNRLLGRGPDREPLVGEVRAIADRTDVDLDVARTVDSETLRMLMSVGGELDRGRCWLTAELLVLEALEAKQTGDPNTAKAAAARALELYSWMPEDWRPLADIPPVSERVAEATASLSDGADARRRHARGLPQTPM